MIIELPVGRYSDLYSSFIPQSFNFEILNTDFLTKFWRYNLQSLQTWAWLRELKLIKCSIHFNSWKWTLFVSILNLRDYLSQMNVLLFLWTWLFLITWLSRLDRPIYLNDPLFNRTKNRQLAFPPLVHSVLNVKIICYQSVSSKNNRSRDDYFSISNGPMKTPER